MEAISLGSILIGTGILIVNARAYATWSMSRRTSPYPTVVTVITVM